MWDLRFSQRWLWRVSINFWDITPCSPLSVNRRFGRTYRLHLKGRRNKFSKKPASKQVASRIIRQKLKSKSRYDRRSVGRSVLVSSPFRGSRPDINSRLTVTVLSRRGALSGERTGLSFVIIPLLSVHIYRFTCNIHVSGIVYIFNIHKASASPGWEQQIMLLSSLSYNGSLVTRMVVRLTAASNSPSQSQSSVTSDCQSVSPSWCRAPSGAHDQMLRTVKTVTILSVWRPLWREVGVCNLSSSLSVYCQSSVDGIYKYY
jgi:hypothetical protein